MVDLHNAKILITGGAGFIGSNFIELVIKNYNNVTIVNLDKMGVGSRSLKHLEGENRGNNKYFFYNSDIRLLNHLYLGNLKLPDLKYDYVFHFAAESHVDRSINSPLDFISNNVIGTSSLLEYLRIHQLQARIINISSDEVYGHLGLHDEPFTENSPVAPRSPYAASKAASDLIALSYHETYGMDVIVTRCCNNYGPWQHSEKFIPTVIRSLMEGKKIPVYGNGQNIREWIHVDDHNKSILEICEQGESGKVYNIGSGQEWNNLDMIQLLVGEVMGMSNYETWEKYSEFVTDRQGHDFRYAIKSLNYKREFELTPFWKGIGETVNHYVEILGNKEL